MENIAILISVKNGAAIIGDALNSIKSQTAFQNKLAEYTVYIVNDAKSTDNLQEVLTPFDMPIVFLSAKEAGIVPARNRGIQCILGKEKHNLIAILDCDDQWLPTKIEEQLFQFLQNPDLDVCGTGMIFVREGEPNRVVLYPETHEAVCYAFLQGANPIGHSSVVYRSKIFNRCSAYDDTYIWCEDCDLFARASKFYRFYNIQRPLVLYNFAPRAEEHNAKIRECARRVWLRELILSGQLCPP